MEELTELEIAQHRIRSLEGSIADMLGDATASVLKINALRDELKIHDTNHTWSKARMFAQNVIDTAKRRLDQR